MNTYHLWQNDQSVGPFSAAVIRDMVQRGQCKSATLVARNGVSEWVPASSYDELVFPCEASSECDVKAQCADAADGEGVFPLQGWVAAALIMAGLVMMMFFMVGFETTVEVKTDSRWASAKAMHNIGRISDRESGVLCGGFLFVGGCVLYASRKRVNSK